MARRYDIIQKMDRKFLLLIQAGLIPTTLLDYKTLYEEYMQQLKENSKTVSVKNVSAKNDISMRTIFRIIAFMEQNITDTFVS